jgi:hypothetical protein
MYDIKIYMLIIPYFIFIMIDVKIYVLIIKAQIFFFIILYQNNQKQSVYTITLQIAKNTIVLDF